MSIVWFCKGDETQKEYKVSRPFYDKARLLWVLLFFYVIYMIFNDQFFYLYMLELRPWEHHLFFVFIFFALGILSIQDFLRGRVCGAVAFSASALLLFFTGMVDTGLNHIDFAKIFFGIFATAASVSAVIFWRHIATALLWLLLELFGWIGIFYLVGLVLEGEEGMGVILFGTLFWVTFGAIFSVSVISHLAWWHIYNKPLPEIIYKIARISMIFFSVFVVPALLFLEVFIGSSSSALSREPLGSPLFLGYMWSLPAVSYGVASMCTRRWLNVKSFDSYIVRPSLLIAIPATFVLLVTFFILESF